MSLYSVEGVSPDEFKLLLDRVKPADGLGFVYSSKFSSVDICLSETFVSFDRDGTRSERVGFLIINDEEELEPYGHAAAHALYWNIRRELEAIRNV